MPSPSSLSLWSPPFRRRCEPEIIHLLCWSGWRATRQANRKPCPLARLARDGHAAAHHAGELARDGEPEPRAAVALRGRGIGLGELLEQLRLLLRSHANAGVGDGELDEVAAIAHLACRK